MLAPGTRIGSRYVVERLLGQGGMSNLYIATDLQQGRAVRVIKEMTARYADPKEQKQAEELFMREGELLATLNHPHIPKVYDKFIFQGKYYLSMDYCQGEDLGKLIQDRGLIEEKVVASWGSQMATVLYYLHRQNPPIVFRDVKPSNIMIVQDQVKLIDFGIARLFSNAKKGDTMRIGSPGYAPPEQYSGQTDPRSDIYALGMTLLHAVTGYDPTNTQTLFQHPTPRSVNPQVSPEMEALILKATQLDPDKRYSNCLDMKRDLQAVMRQHGLVVGISAPFSAQLQSQAQLSSQPQPQPTPVLPKLTPVQAPAPANPVATSVSVATVAATTVTATQPPANKAVPSVKRGSGGWGWLTLILVAVSFGLLKAPSSWRQALTRQVQTLLIGLTGNSQPSLSPGEQVLLGGGPLLAAAEELGAAVRANKASLAQRLAYQNALLYASGHPLSRLTVLSDRPPETLLPTLLSWQAAQNNKNYREGKLVLLSLQSVDKNWPRAIQLALAGSGFRLPEKPEALLVIPPSQRPAGWSPWFEKVPHLYWLGPRQAADPPQAQSLNANPDLGEWLKQSQMSDCIWLAKTPAAPAGIKTETFSPEAMAKVLKQNPKPVLVIDPEQLKGLQTWPKAAGLRLLTLNSGPPRPLFPPALPAGVKLYSLCQASPWTQDPMVAHFFSPRARQQAELNPELFDGLCWTANRMLGETRQLGLSWRSDRNAQLQPAPWQLLEARPAAGDAPPDQQGSWIWLKSAGERP